jgi:hypothetical protein
MNTILPFLALVCFTLPQLLASPNLVVGIRDSALAGVDTTREQKALLNSFASSGGHLLSFDSQIQLTEFPVYGKTVDGAKGELSYKTTASGGLICSVTLNGLLPGHQYILTLNGNPERKGNTNLISFVPGNEKEKYYDFQVIMTDSKGTFSSIYGVALPASDYDLRFYVKDTSDFKIVLYHDFFKFVVSL